MAVDSLTTQGALDAEEALRIQGDGRLANFAGAVLLGGIPDGNQPDYASYGTLIDLVNLENLTQAMWRLDNNKQRKITAKDDGTTVLANPNALDFVGAANDGFLVSVSGSGVTIALDALGKWWTGDPGDGDPTQEITSTGAAVEFDYDRFATGITVTKTLIGHISAVWSVVSGVTLKGRKVRLGANP